MREIKFRVWCASKKEWEKDSIYLSQHGNIIHDLRHGRSMICRPQTHIVQFYTGLRDKNGVEIYEGDIARYTFDNPDSVTATDNGLKARTGKVYWQEWRGSFAIGSEMANNDLYKYVRNGNRVEVIGNIYENPDLLGTQP